MKKEIGSIYPLQDEVLKQAETIQMPFDYDRLYYSLCREALYDIAKALVESNKVVLLPAYTCQTVITPFKEVGWRCEFFSISRDLRINAQSLLDAFEKHHPSVLVVHPYFGMDLNDEEIALLNDIKLKGIHIIVDLTQCLFSTQLYSFASFVVASYRKWMPLPDGGYLKSFIDEIKISQPEDENKEFIERELAAMYLRNQYFANCEKRTKEISIRLSKAADFIVESNITSHRMSQVAYNLLRNEDLHKNQKCRFDNFTFLFENINKSDKVSKVCSNLQDVTTAPLYFTIYVNDRSTLQFQLAQDAIYAPVIWPFEDERVLIDEDVRYIYEHLLAIPCDQRYGIEDLQRVVTIINNY